MVLECSKDSVAQAYNTGTLDRFPGKEPKTYNDSIDIKDKDSYS